MRKLKNFTVVAKSLKNGLKGYVNYLSYLNDRSRHDNQDIVDLSHKNAKSKMAAKAELFNLKRKLSKGGRPSNIGHSFMLAYPFEINDDDFAKLINEILIDFYKFVFEKNKVDLDEKQIKNLVEQETIKIIHRGRDINNHIHLIVPKHITKVSKGILNKKSEVISVDLSEKKYSHRLKVINDLKVQEILKINTADYKIKSLEDKPQKKRRTKSQIARDKLKSQQKQESEAFKVLYDEINDLLDELQGIKHTLSIEEATQAQKELLRARKQVENENDKRAKKSIDKAKNIIKPEIDENKNKYTPKPGM